VSNCIILVVIPIIGIGLYNLIIGASLIYNLQAELQVTKKYIYSNKKQYKNSHDTLPQDFSISKSCKNGFFYKCVLESSLTCEGAPTCRSYRLLERPVSCWQVEG